jgi:hypothetical protein
VSNSDVVDFINQFRLSTEPAAESVKSSEPVSASEAPEPVVATPIKGRKEKKISDFLDTIQPIPQQQQQDFVGLLNQQQPSRPQNLRQ